MDALDTKETRLKGILAGLGGAVIGYSGGCDSTLLALLAREALGERALLVLAAAETYPAAEVAEALATAAALGLPVLQIKTGELGDPAFVANTPERCYHCKRELFGRLAALGRERGIPWVADGSNVDDLADYRPGARAAAEQGVRSPLREAGLTKAEIRELSRRRGLPTWDKPAFACLATRLPYGTPIEAALLARLEAAEGFLRALGFRQVRVRHHGPLARIEVAPEAIPRLAEPELRRQVAERFRTLGWLYTTLDLDGYRTGSMNAVLGEREPT